MARPRRESAKKVDYSQFQDPDAPHDDDDFGDDMDVTMDDFHEENDEDDEASAEEEEDDDEDKDRSEEEEGEDVGEIVEVDEISRKAKKSTKATKPRTTKAKPIPVKKAPRKVKPTATAKPVKSPGEKTEVLAMKSITNYKDKLQRFFGCNLEKLVSIIEYKKVWESELFTAPADLCDEFQYKGSRLELGDTSIIQIDAERFYDSFLTVAQEDIKEIQFNNFDSAVRLHRGQATVNNSGAMLLNCGFNVTDLLWISSTKADSNDMFLLVAISEDLARLGTGSQTSSFFKKKETQTAGFQLYHMDGLTKELRLVRCITHDFGNSWDLKVVSLDEDNEKVYICSMFNDLTVKFCDISLKMDLNSIDYLQMTAPAMEISLYDESITAYDISENKQQVIVGTDNGNVLLYDLTVSSSVPLKSQCVANSHIFSLAYGESPYDETLIYGTSANGTTFAFNTLNLSNSLNILPRAKGIALTTKYSKQLYSFIQSDGQYPTRMLPARCMFLSCPLVKHEGCLTSLAISNHHPLFLSGGSDGAVKIGSLLRRILCGPKGNFHRLLTFWQFEFSQTLNIYRLVKSFEVEKMNALDNANNLPLYQREIGISAVAWAQGTKQMGSWFAAACVSGLVVLDKAE